MHSYGPKNSEKVTYQVGSWGSTIGGLAGVPTTAISTFRGPLAVLRWCQGSLQKLAQLHQRTAGGPLKAVIMVAGNPASPPMVLPQLPNW